MSVYMHPLQPHMICDALMLTLKWSITNSTARCFQELKLCFNTSCTLLQGLLPLAPDRLPNSGWTISQLVCKACTLCPVRASCQHVWQHMHIQLFIRLCAT